MNLLPLTRACLAFVVTILLHLSASEAPGQWQDTSLLPRPSLEIRFQPPIRRPANWYPYVIARRGDRMWIRSTPVELRPNRPMHFWGNARRRILR